MQGGEQEDMTGTDRFLVWSSFIVLEVHLTEIEANLVDKALGKQIIISDLLSDGNEVFRSYAFWVAVLLLKTLAMSVLTGLQRFRTKTFANPEDLPSKKLKVKFDDPDVERVRRAHRNDLENVLPFVTIGFFYLLTNPAPWLAITLFRVGAIARVVHTLVYAVVVIPQPSRALAFFATYGISIYMGIQCVFYFL